MVKFNFLTMKKDDKSQKLPLRKKAEELLEKKQLKPGSQHSEAETLKLIHELEVHQIELELQNDELIMARSAAQDAAEKYIELYDFAPAGYFTLSKEGKINKLNLSGSQLLGKERERLKNSRFGSFVSDDTRQNFNLFLRKVFNSKVKETCEVALRSDGNSPTYVYLSGIITENEEQCLVTAVDNTELKMSLEALAIQVRVAEVFLTVSDDEMFNEMLKIILEVMHSPFGVFGYIDEEGASVIPTMTRQVWNECEVSGKSIRFPRETWGNSTWAKALREKKIIFSNKPSTRIPEGHVNINRHISAPILFQGEPIGLFQVANKGKDYTDADLRTIETISRSVAPILNALLQRKQAAVEIKLKNEELIKLNAEKDKFFSIIAHDLTSPFNSFLGFTKILAEKLPVMEQDEIQEIAYSLKNSATNLYHLIVNLLEWSRMQRGLTEFKPETIPLIDVVKKSTEGLSNLAYQKNQEIQLQVPENLIVKVDKVMLESTLRNLLNNAVKFSFQGGKISISAKVIQDNFIEISITDTGIGMSEELLGKLFQINEPVGRKGTEEEPSAGLGLIICKDFVEKHGGKIQAESIEGKGSTFRFTLPANMKPETGSRDHEAIDNGYPHKP